MTQSERMIAAIDEIGGAVTNHGDPNRISFTMPSGTTIDDVMNSIAEIKGYYVQSAKGVARFEAIKR